MKTKYLLLSIMGLATFFQATAQCTAGAIVETVWGSPSDFDLGFTIDTDITNTDTIEVTQGTNGTQVMQYLLPKKQAITTPITTTATVNSVQIVGVSGLPVGLSWTLDTRASGNNNTYYPQTYRYGAVTVCGTTYANPGNYTLTVNTIGTGSAMGQTQSQPVSFPLYLKVLPGSGGNSAFTFSPAVGCDSLNVDFEAIFQSPNDTFFPLEFNWDFGDGTAMTNTPRMENHNYSTPGTYPVKLDVLMYEYYISSVTIVATGGWYPDIEEPSSLFDPELYGNILGYSLPEQGSGKTQTWTTDVSLSNGNITCQFWDKDVGGLFGSADDDLGTGSTIVNTPSNGLQVAITTNNYIATAKINKRVSNTLTFWDTVRIHPSSMATAIAHQATTFCQGDSTTISISGSYASVQWYNDTTELTGETNNSLLVNTTGSYYAKVVEAGSICDGYSNRIDVAVNAVDVPSITQSSSGALEVNNPNGYSIQWLSNGVPIPSATTNTLTDLSSGNPFTVSFTSSTGCTATSTPFTATILQAGTSTQSGNELTPTTPIDFTASGFSMCAGQEIAWAVSTQADGAITNTTELQTAINNGWVYPSSGQDSLHLSCANATFPLGAYYMTPISINASNIEPVYWNSNTDSGYCDAKMEICIQLSGTNYEINPLTITLPNGTTIDVLQELAGLSGVGITPALWDVALQQAGGGSSLCLDLIDLLNYYDNPNGTWSINANNVGSGSATLTVANFNIEVDASTCDSLATDQVIPIQGFSNSISAGSSGSFNIVVPPVPSNFPSIDSNCLLFGTATQFNSACIDTIPLYFCSGDSTSIVLNQTNDSIQWYADGVAIPNATDSILIVNTSAVYNAQITNAGITSSSNIYVVNEDSIPSPTIIQNALTLTVQNTNNYTIQWFSNGNPIAGATSNTLTDLSSGNPFTVSFTSSNSCTATSSPFTATVLQAGTSTQSGNELTPTTPIDFTASGFSMCSGESIAWAVSTKANGAITNRTELQTAIDNGWVFPSSGTDSLNLNCSNATFPPGDYFMTPFTAQSYDPNCVPNGKLCMEIEAEDGVKLITDQLIFTFPDGSTKNLRAIVPADYQSLLPDTIEKTLIDMLPTFVPGGSLCFNLSDLYSGTPNGTWTVSAQNAGTGSMTVTIPSFEVGVYTDSCSAITQNEVSQIPITSETIAGGSSGQLSFTINATSHTPAFPTVNTNCLLFGSATEFSSTCVTSITTIANVENLIVYPNPNNGIFTLEFELDKTEAVEINIIDITGRVVLNREYPNIRGKFKEQFDLKNNLNVGFYVIDININGNRTQRKIIVK